jgi:hypothetical protein
MRFKAGFVLGCAAGAWAVSKASQMRRTDPPSNSWPRVVSSRADMVNAEATVERLRAVGDLARERLGDLVDSQRRNVARDRVSSLLSSLGDHLT